MNELMRIGVDLAKNVFQVHGVDRRERPVWCKRLPRSLNERPRKTLGSETPIERYRQAVALTS